MQHFVIVGAGQAGFSVAAKLRSEGFQGRVTVLGDESAPPYQRPPLSKQYLLGDMTRERLFLRPTDFYAENEIDLRLNTGVTALDPAAKTISCGAHQMLYDQLVLATGSRPRHLPSAIGGALAGVFTVRTLADIDAMADAFKAGARVLIVGGGYIGLEAAAVAAKRGLQVTVAEMSDRILQRVAARETSDAFRSLHSDHGVTIREGIGLARLLGETHVTGAELSDGTTLGIDFAVVGVGITPCTELAEAAGLEIDNGISTDAQGRTSDPSIWAAGDCASFPYQGRRIRLESVPNAIDQAEIVARNMLGANIDYIAKPWFWSDQYDVKLQIAGLNSGFDQVVVRTDGTARSHWYYRTGELLAVDALNDPRSYMVGKRLIEAAKSPRPDVMADPSTDLKSLLK